MIVPRPRMQFTEQIREKIIREVLTRHELRRVMHLTATPEQREGAIRSVLVRWEGGHPPRSEIDDVLFRLFDYIARKLPSEAKILPGQTDDRRH